MYGRGATVRVSAKIQRIGRQRMRSSPRQEIRNANSLEALRVCKSDSCNCFSSVLRYKRNRSIGRGQKYRCPKMDVSSAKGNLTATRTTKMAIKAEVIQTSRRARNSFHLTVGRTDPTSLCARDFNALLRGHPFARAVAHSTYELKATKEGYEKSARWPRLP